MPIEELHKKKRARNFMILGAVVGWCALIWIITMIKISNGG